MHLCWLRHPPNATICLRTQLGCLLGISETVVGLTIGAIGTSLPDCLVSLHVARKGQGTMMVANVFGSNIFDMLFALGLPMFLGSIWYEKDFEVDSVGLDAIILIGIFLLFVASLCVFNFQQGGRIGVAYVAAYAMFLILCFLPATEFGGGY